MSAVCHPPEGNADVGQFRQAFMKMGDMSRPLYIYSSAILRMHTCLQSIVFQIVFFSYSLLDLLVCPEWMSPWPGRFSPGSVSSRILSASRTALVSILIEVRLAA